MSMVTPLIRTTLPVASALGGRRAETPAHLAIRAAAREIPPGAARRRAAGARMPSLQPLPVLGHGSAPRMFSGVTANFPARRRRSRCWPSSHRQSAVDEVPVPRAHVAGGERQAAPLLAFAAAARSRLRARRCAPRRAAPARRSAARARASCDRARRRPAPWRAAPPARPAPARSPPRPSRSRAGVDFGEMDGRDEDDRRLLEARMLADHRGSWKPSRSGMQTSTRMTAISFLSRCSSASLPDAP